jgi:hypothetical protein
LSGGSAEASKAQKYADITTSVDFVPVAFETTGSWGAQGFDLIRKIGKRLAEVTHESRAASSASSASFDRNPTWQRVLCYGNISEYKHWGYRILIVCMDFII